MRRRVALWWLFGGLVVALLALVDVTVTAPRISVRWQAGVAPADRQSLEQRYGLRNGEADAGAPSTWRYDLGDRSRDNIRALIENPAVDDTGNLDRDAFSAPPQDVQVTLRPRWYPFSDLFDRPSQLLQLHRSVWLLLSGGVLIWIAGAGTARRRGQVAVATLLLVGAIALVFPLDPSFVTMGEAYEHGENRYNFERYFGGRVRYEKHLSQTILLKLYESDPSETAPANALIAVSRGATAWFVVSALAIGFVERWSTVVVRYLGLALLAPAALLYFGWREFGYLSLNVAAFPLLARGLRDGGPRLEAASAVTGFGAALHGSGLVALAGTWLATITASAPWQARFTRVLRVVVWGTAAYVGWIAVYVIVLKLQIDPAPPGPSMWRPWFADEVREGRIATAILSAAGARDLSMSAWVVGVPLLAVVASLWRQYSEDVRTALVYSLPSLVFVFFRWPFQGIGGGMDLVLAGFPALYALAWLCAHDGRRTAIAAALLASAHLAFWRIVLDAQFEAVQIA